MVSGKLPERGLRCENVSHCVCQTADAAASLGSDFYYYLTISSTYKDSAFINSCGGQLSQNVGIPLPFLRF